MKTNKYHRLPQPRVDKITYEGIHAIAKAQEMTIAEVVRAALREYVKPHPELDIVHVPVIGVLKDGKIYLYRDKSDLLVEPIPFTTLRRGDKENAGQQVGSPHQEAA